VLPVLPHEDPRALARRVQEWTEDCQPATAMERDLIACAARLSWVLERAEKAEAAQLAQRIEQTQANADGTQDAQVRKLGWDLFSLGLRSHKHALCTSGPAALRNIAAAQHLRSSTYALCTCSGADPSAIVGRLESTAEGCRWLLEQWAEQQRALRLGTAWTTKRLIRLVRLLGREGTSVAWEPGLNAAVLAADVLKPGLANEFWTLRLRAIPSDEDRLEEPEDWRELAPRPASADEARDALLAVISEQVVRLNVRLSEHEAGAARASVKLAEAAAFDPGAESERLHKFQTARHRELVRTVELVRKLHKDPLPEPEFELEPEGPNSVGWAPPTEHVGACAGGQCPPYEPLPEEAKKPPIGPNEAAAEQTEVVLNSEVTPSHGDVMHDDRSQIEPAAETRQQAAGSGQQAVAPRASESGYMSSPALEERPESPLASSLPAAGCSQPASST
jgi:hypothetical protein